MSNKKREIAEVPGKNNLLDAIKKIQGTDIQIPDTQQKEVVDIITFCESPLYLNLPKNNFNLFMSQRVILKSFYSGSKGNENLKLSQEEWQWLYDHVGEDVHGDYKYERNTQDVIDKLLKKEKEKFNFNELHLVIGRRATKTALASIISSYEAYKLLTIGNGDPYAFFHIPYDDEIAIINVATSGPQAGRLFTQIKNRIRNAPFFKGRVASESTTAIRLYTDIDLRKKKDSAGLNLEIPGSIVIVCGHSNSDSLRGYTAMLILFDELAFYDTEGIINGEKFYNDLIPSIKQFKKYGEGRLVEISSPGPPTGIFYKIHEMSKKFDNILSFQLPTWNVTSLVTFDDLATERLQNPEVFAVEYGGQWPKSGIYGNYFPEGLIERCVRSDIYAHDKPLPGFVYYLHVDPAQSGDRYVALLIAKDNYRHPNGEKRIRCRLANMWLWTPAPGRGLIFADIDKEMIQICGKYHPAAVSYDQWQSGHSLQLLNRHGVHTVQTCFNSSYKNRIYQNLKDMMNFSPYPELWLYDDQRLIQEMRHLRFRPTQRGVSLVVDKHGAVKTDDCVDCLCGACAVATQAAGPMPLPLTTTVRMGYI